MFTAPTPAFLDGLGFDADNPPNAAMIMETGEGGSDIAVVELFNPTYDDTTHTATYDVAVLANWQNDLEMGFKEAPVDLSSLASSFGATHLFIDDCGWGTVDCLLDEEIAAVLTNVPTIYFGEYYSCIPYAPGATSFREMDDYYVAMCNKVFPEECQGRCQDGAFLDFL